MSASNAVPVAGLDEFTSAQLAEVDEIIKSHAGKPGALIPVLEQVQEILGYLPMAVQQRVAKGLNIPVANVYGVVTFYSFFTMVPRGKHNIRVCLGTACYVRGGQRILETLKGILGIEPGGCTPDRLFSLETVRCLGACGLAPVMVIDEDTHGQMKPAKLEGVLSHYK
ncbi:MAG: NAD(P)H-dependent oxidoreductase subunit E [Syntrophaceae bacterium]